MESGLRIRRPRSADAAVLARLHVASWRRTYRGLMPDEVLDAPDFVARRELFWTAAITDPRWADNTIAVAELDDVVVGMAMAGPALDDDATWDRQLFVLYTDAAIHGLGVGAALLDAVLDRSAPASLWVADPNPRAQAFYRKHGFVADGTVKTEEGVREIRMTRGGATARPEQVSNPESSGIRNQTSRERRSP